MDNLEDEEEPVKKEEELPRRRAKKIIIPRREPSIVIPPKEIIYITPDKTTCVFCPCFLPKEETYVTPKRKKLLECQKTPATLYELAAAIVDKLGYPEAFEWSIEDVVQWLKEVVGLPQYEECITDNKIDGMRLLMLEDPSKLPMINIHDFEHIKMITKNVRKLYGMDYIRFYRSLGLPYRRPLIHGTWFKSRTGPSWGIRRNWGRCDLFRWMKIISPIPQIMNAWDFVWYIRPDFPRQLFGPGGSVVGRSAVPRYMKDGKTSGEFKVRRKFIIDANVRPSQQFIWMEETPWFKREETITKPKEKKKPKKVHGFETGPQGRALLLARRKMNKQKFLP